MEGFEDKWSDITALLQDGRGPSGSLRKLALQASVYFIWRERNRRLFGDAGMVPIQIFKQVRNIVLLRMAWKFRKTYTSMYV